MEGEHEKPEALEHYLIRFPEIVAQASATMTPSYLTTYLLELTHLFNSYYAAHQVIDKENSVTSYRLALTAATAQVLKNGLTILGIPVIERM